MTPEEFKLMKDVLNEMIIQHNGLVRKVDEIVTHINRINKTLFEAIETSDKLDS
jgi:transposase